MLTWEELKEEVMTWDWYDADGNLIGRVVDINQITLEEGQTLVERPCPRHILQSHDFFAAVVEKIDSLEARVAELEK